MELFIKRFIDLLDEVVPVSMVHTLIEQPLGAVMHDSYIRIHARLDLIDEYSPYVEIEIYPHQYKYIEILYAYTFPNKSVLISEGLFLDKIKENENITGEKVFPIFNDDDYFYELFYGEEIEIPNNNTGIDDIIREIVSNIKKNITISGYGHVDEE